MSSFGMYVCVVLKLFSGIMKAAGKGSVTNLTNRQNIISKGQGLKNYIYLDLINLGNTTITTKKQAFYCSECL